MKLHHRKLIRRAWRTTFRSVNHSCVRVRWRAPDDLGDALTAFGRALRARRRLAKLAPRFFDEAVIDREAYNRAEQRRWMATWEPVLARVYGVAHAAPAPTNELPPLPPPRIQRAVDRQLAAWQLWMEIGRAAMQRQQQRHPHAILSLIRLVRLTEQALDFKKLALGLDSPNPLPDKITYELTNLKRAYGHRDGQSHSSENFPGTAAPPHGPCGSGRESAPASVPPLDPKPPVPALPPPETKRDITPVKLVVGPHGFLTYEYPKPASDHS